MTSARRRAVVLLVPLALGWLAVPPSRASAQILAPSKPRVFVFLVPGASFEDLLAVPELRALARAGGAALMSHQGSIPLRPPAIQVALDGGQPGPVRWIWMKGGGPGALAEAGREIRNEVWQAAVDPVLVIVVSPSASPQMRATKDELHPIVEARGTPVLLFPQRGEVRTLESDTTRRVGVVTDLDIRPTIQGFLGRPESGEGSVLRIVDEPAPFELHARYLAMRRMTVPIQTAAGVWVTLAGLFGVALLAFRRRVPVRLARIGAWLALSVPILAVGLLAAGHLPTLSYATVVPFVVGVTVVGALAFAPLAKRDVLLAPAAIGWAVLAYFLVEAVLGWTAALTPFLAGSELDGGRFYGLPNEFIGLLVGAALYAATRLKPVTGFVLVIAVALFAGLPFGGSNLGGAITVFAAAGLWLPIRSRGGLDWKGVAFAVGVILAGLTLVLLSHRFLTSGPTHITRFEETGGRSLSGVWHTFTDRLLVGWRLILRNPFALVPVLGVPATLYAVLRPPTPVRVALEQHLEWRDAILVTLLAGLVAILPNDSWPAAMGLEFALGLGGLVYVSLIEGTWKMERA